LVLTQLALALKTILAPSPVWVTSGHGVARPADGISLVDELEGAFLAVIAINGREMIGVAAFRPLLRFELGRARQFRFVGLKMQDFLGDVVMQSARWHGRQRIANTDYPAGGNDHLDDAPGFHIHGEVFHLAELFVLIIVDRHSDDVAGFGGTIQPVALLGIWSALPSVGGSIPIRFGIGGVLSQSRAGQNRSR
jgi:hypothetical protein